MPRFFLLFLVFFQLQNIAAQTLSFGLKSAPPDLAVSLNGELLEPVSKTGTIRNYLITGEQSLTGALRFSAAGYVGKSYSAKTLPLKNNLLEIKLEKENGVWGLLGEFSTGSQPKSAYFSGDGGRLFIPLLNQRGIDVFRFESAGQAGRRLNFEKRLLVPGSTSAGYVEALCDERRRELWVSNMEDNKVHIFNLDTLDFKQSLATGGSYPKVIAQNPAGDITVVSNWVSQDITVFDSATKKLLRRIPVGGTPRGMAFSPDGAFLYTAIYDGPVVAVVDMKQNKVSSRFSFHEGEGAARHVIYRNEMLYVSDMFKGTVIILDAKTGALLVSRRIGPNINTIVLSPDGRHVFASSRGLNNSVDYTRPGPDLGAVYMLKSDDLSLVEKIWGRNQPTGLAVSPDGKYLAFTDFLDANLELYIINQTF